MAIGHVYYLHMLNITRHGILLEATSEPFENQAVLNPATLQEGTVTHLFYRAVSQGNYSSIGYARLEQGAIVYRSKKPILTYERAYERHGIEDPRIVFLDGTYYLFYTVFDGTDAQVAYATAKELPHFTKHGIISPHVSYAELATVCRKISTTKDSFSYLCNHLWLNLAHNGEILLWEKDAFTFPRKVGGKYLLMHRIKPEIQLLAFDSFDQLRKKYWLDHLAHLESATVLTPMFGFEDFYVGGGAPPIETSSGWLLIYHAVQWGIKGPIYRGAAALLDINNPAKVLGRLPYPLLSPEMEYERQGDVGNVVFPTGVTLIGDSLTLYYGAADTRIAYASLSATKLINELLHHGANPIPRTSREAMGLRTHLYGA